MVGVPVFSDWRKFSAMLIHVHARPGHALRHVSSLATPRRGLRVSRVGHCHDRPPPLRG